MLLKAGANPDAAGMYSWSPLLVATKGNFPDIVVTLLDYKPNVNAMDKDGYPALTIACREGYYEIVVALLNHGAYTNLLVHAVLCSTDMRFVLLNCNLSISNVVLFIFYL